VLPRRQANLELEKFVTGPLTMNIAIEIDLSLQCNPALPDNLLRHRRKGAAKKNKTVR